ncbi:hypothetical protein FRB91_010895 [Serendipita sp. 411]|nr:hypothetical protein FRC15_005223 [Serendipita sp. 397]KAG8777109.1 hypothetical protein FRC16_004286 [Serendipita sp. 398]KAG8847845.1 hypothetical protein FRC20_002664 [Serendipita sp. 405]KAG8857737.1 hypothetical protein FRB91_010895 [Serendipita sp. 411]
MIVDSLPRLQKLFVSFVSNPADFDDLAECWSQAASIHELIYSMNNGWLWLLKDFLLAPHVQHLPYLSSLSLDNAGNVSVPPPGAHPLLPNLTTLTLGSAGPSLALYRLTTLLSHCPLLQRVACKSGKYVEEHHQNLQFFQLRHLSSIETDQELPLKIFSSYIETPVLRKLTLYKYSGDWITEFVQKNRGIEDLILNVRTSPSYDIILTYLTQLRVLSVGGHGHGHFLRPLYTPLPRNSGAPPCAETLQRLEIVISRDKLHMEYFEKLVHARFIPVNKEGYTAAGCKAMHELILIAVEYNQVSKQVQESVLWKRAKITKPRSEVFVLHWDFEDTAETS